MSAIRKSWRVEGMHCPRCEGAVRRALRDLPGLEEVEVCWSDGALTALWDAELLPESRIDARLRAEGYGLIRASGRTELLRKLAKLGLALAAALLMYLLLTRTPVARWSQAFPLAREGMGLSVLFAVGLATSLHCVAMCGGINLAQSAASAQRGGRPARANLLYNLGRLCSYALTGGFVGALGTAVSIGSGAKAAIRLLAAAFMLLMALNLLGCFDGLRRLTPRLPESLRTRMLGSAAGRSSFYIGLANGLMPCGPLQSMQLYALSAGSWWRGALSMACFCLGTIPLMLGFGLAGGGLNRRFARPMRLISAVLVLVMGVSALSDGLALAGVDAAATATSAGETGVAIERGDAQYVQSELEFGGYPEITVQAGVPVVWTIHAEADRINSCNREIYIPKFDMSVSLKPGDNEICFTPDEPGAIPYTCWMGMLRGVIRVRPRRSESEF